MPKTTQVPSKLLLTDRQSGSQLELERSEGKTRLSGGPDTAMYVESIGT